MAGRGNREKFSQTLNQAENYGVKKSHKKYNNQETSYKIQTIFNNRINQ